MKASIFSYHFLTIWPNGFKYIEEILNILRSDPEIEIISIKKHKVRNMRKFVFDLYACDDVPLEHLYKKLNYLFKFQPEVIDLFIKNFNPYESTTGRGEFKKSQCLKMVDLKNQIRNEFNPRHSDPNYQLAPLGKGVSHEHVIHASDSEKQTDYYLKLLGYKKGIDLLFEDNEGLFFKKPFYIPRPDNYSIRMIPSKDLLARIYYYDGSNTRTRKTPIAETPHYEAANGNFKLYDDYLANYQFKVLNDNYSSEKYKQMIELPMNNLQKLPLILVKKVENGHLILDGVHRAAVLASRGFKKIVCAVINDD